jgi:predicted amidophosphoribosyltransferase
MDTDIAPPRSVSSHLRSALGVCRGAWTHAAKLALDIALPTRCVACREPVDGEGVCASCWAKLSFIAPRGSAFPLSTIPAPNCCRWKRSPIRRPASARAAVRFDEVARTLVHALKYQDRTDLAPAVGRWMARAGREMLEAADLLIPVPLHWRRACTAVTISPARWRGWSNASAG